MPTFMLIIFTAIACINVFATIQAARRGEAEPAAIMGFSAGWVSSLVFFEGILS